MTAPEILEPDLRLWPTYEPETIGERETPLERHIEPTSRIEPLRIPSFSPEGIEEAGWSVTPRRPRAWLRRTDLVIIIAVLCTVHIHEVFRIVPPDWNLIARVPFRLGHVLVLFGCAYVWVKTYELLGLYSEPKSTRFRDELQRLVIASIIGVCATVIAHHFLPDAIAYRDRALLSTTLGLWGVVVGLTACVHGLRWRMADRMTGRQSRNVLIVGSGPRAVKHYRTLTSDSRGRYHVAGFVDITRHGALSELEMPLVGRLYELEDVIGRLNIDEVYVALPLMSCYQEFQHAVHLCQRLGVRVLYSLEAFQYLTPQPKYQHVGDTSFAMVTPVTRDAYLPSKRLIDIVVSATALLILSPAFLVIAVLVKCTSKGPIFFAQQRFGQHRRPFKLYKFRSMRIDAEEMLRKDQALRDEYRRNHFKLPESRDPRITAIGRILRKTSLDELPQIWNVLRGDMSVIGPRPVVPAEIEHYGSFAPLLLALKPGLTGAWVVNGRSAVGYPRRAEIELAYVRSWSLWRDVRIFVRTIPAVLMGKGAH